MKLFTLNNDSSALFVKNDEGTIINLYNTYVIPEGFEEKLTPVKASEKDLVVNKFYNNVEAKINADKTRMLYAGGEARERLRRTIMMHSKAMETLRALL